MDDREARFRTKVERRGDHDVWTGAIDAKGTGLVRIDGRLRTVQRAAWEFAHGPLSPGERVLTCPGEKACVRLDHLRLAGVRTSLGVTVARRRRGSGSMREIRPGVWRLTVSDGPGPDGAIRRRHATVHGAEADAAEHLTDLVETTHGPTRLGDMRVRELIDRYLTWLDDDADEGVQRLRRLAEDVVEPAVGREYAALLDSDAVAHALETAIASGVPAADIRGVHRLLGDAYRWARRRRWTRRDPLATVVLRDIVG